MHGGRGIVLLWRHGVVCVLGQPRVNNVFYSLNSTPPSDSPTVHFFFEPFFPLGSGSVGLTSRCVTHDMYVFQSSAMTFAAPT